MALPPRISFFSTNRFRALVPLSPYHSGSLRFFANVTHVNPSSSFSTLNPLPATFLRGGTSKGIFLNRSQLPTNTSEWGPIFLGIMGSPDPVHGRQLNGMGGGVSSLSKIIVVSPPTEETKKMNESIQCEYTFVQVGIKDETIDLTGNCGNLSSMVGVFAFDEGICGPMNMSEGRDGIFRATVRSWNTNTHKIIDTTFPISSKAKSSGKGPTEDHAALLDLPETSIAGVPGLSSSITLDFINPSGARTGKLLPTGSPSDTVTVKMPDGNNAAVTVSCVDATNPTVFVSYDELSALLPGPAGIEAYLSPSPSSSYNRISTVLEFIRRAGATLMSLDPNAQAQPKIAILRNPHTEEDKEQGVDLVIHALSMGVLHKAVPMTVGLCAGVAACTEGTLAWNIVQRVRRAQGLGLDSRSGEKGEKGGMIRLRHPSGIVDVGAEFGGDGSVRSAKVVRTGRRLMKGAVWW